jgi:hypothetical protein
VLNFETVERVQLWIMQVVVVGHQRKFSLLIQTDYLIFGALYEL